MNKVPHARMCVIRPNLLATAADLLTRGDTTATDPGPAGVREALLAAAGRDTTLAPTARTDAADTAWRHVEHLWRATFSWRQFGTSAGWAAMLRYAATVPAGQ